VPEHVLHDLAAFHRALQRHPRMLLFKHSPACAISAAARDSYDAFRRSLLPLQDRLRWSTLANGYVVAGR
jgi:hypothetical protein